MARLRYNGLSTTLGAALTNADTAVTFGAALTHAGGAIPTIVAPDYIPLSILGSDGRLAEVVRLTAYTSGATTGTISRAQEGSTAAAHSSGASVLHGPTTMDLAAVEEKASYRGQWVAGPYVSGEMVKDPLGNVFIANKDTTQAPVLPGADYSADFTIQPTEGFWDFSGVGTMGSYAVAPISDVRTDGAAPTNGRCLRLKGAADNQRPYFELTLNFPTGGTIAFKDAASTEGADPGIFYIDGAQRHSTAEAWAQRTYSVAAGVHVFRWLHHHDYSVLAGSNAYGIADLVTTGSVFGADDWDVIADIEATTSLGGRVDDLQGRVVDLEEHLPVYLSTAIPTGAVAPYLVVDATTTPVTLTYEDGL